ncbi:hypothetical protein NDU88_005930 [Pleurodeles waltl]|uniref:Uncharacterized protein n=1 Tax=Pleurodeles waltl TaxID=8319 RepID=A0AAV7LMM1_PLEWA|nr:hypothetical protein NDU88_005930 [Pleurodeles waltl]
MAGIGTALSRRQRGLHTVCLALSCLDSLDAGPLVRGGMAWGSSAQLVATPVRVLTWVKLKMALSVPGDT